MNRKNFSYLLLGSVLVLSCQTETIGEYPQSTHPVWSPDGERIAFINNAEGVRNNNAIDFEVFIMNRKGQGVKQLTFNDAFEADIAWSPDGSQLAVKSYRDGNDEVYLIDLATGTQQNISNDPGRDGSPQFVGGRLIFESRRDHEKGELYAYDLSSGETERLTNNEIQESGAVWSPDGSMVVFTSSKDGDDDLYLMKASGDSLLQLTNNPLNDWYPQWSPDGSTILYTYGDWETDEWELRLLTLSDHSEKVVIKGNDSGNASWHPDGNKIAYASSKEGAGHVYVLDLASGEEERLTGHE